MSYNIVRKIVIWTVLLSVGALLAYVLTVHIKANL